ncbi:MAG: lytic transglycosylase domain-containing protein [Coriobacteriia bacterium]|nr:lytic transglycosylase domain-containing protein [Coriobacteriia bacterium]
MRVAIRWILLAAIIVMAGATWLFLRGPSFWQRGYYPLHYQSEIATSATRHRVNPYLVAAIINAESSWKPETTSSAGAVGLMQILPSTAEDLARWRVVDGEKFPLERLSDPAVNIEYGTAYVRYLVGRYHEIETVLAAYNAGLRHADEWAAKGGNIRTAIEYPETKHYVLRVSRGKDRYQSLYPGAFER